MTDSEPDSDDANEPTSPESITPETLHERLADGESVTILDTRDRDEFEAWHVDAKFVQAEVTGGVEDLADANGLADGDGPIVAVCARGEASDHAAGLLRGAGIEAVNLEGGMESWARTYVSNEIRSDGRQSGSTALAVRQYVRPSSGCLAYLVYGGDEAIVVDPLRAFADRYAEDARDLGVEVVGVVDTHVHADHLSGLREVADRTGARTYLPEGAAERGLASEADVELLGDGDELWVDDGAIEALHVPGHTSEMTALLVRGDRHADADPGEVLLSGDSLFVESVARPDLEAGDEGAPDLAARLHASLHDRILELPDDTIVAPGHVGPRTTPGDAGSYSATLADLREGLDLLGLDREAFVERVLSDMPPRPANYETIIAVNLGREDVDDEAGFELELGPNNCAVSA